MQCNMHVFQLLGPLLLKSSLLYQETQWWYLPTFDLATCSGKNENQPIWLTALRSEEDAACPSCIWSHLPPYSCMSRTTSINSPQEPGTTGGLSPTFGHLYLQSVHLHSLRDRYTAKLARIKPAVRDPQAYNPPCAIVYLCFSDVMNFALLHGKCILSSIKEVLIPDSPCCSPPLLSAICSFCERGFPAFKSLTETCSAKQMWSTACPLSPHASTGPSANIPGPFTTIHKVLIMLASAH